MARPTGRPSIFRDKTGGRRVQGYLTRTGAELFETARGRLARLAKRAPTQVSDADVQEYLARGDAATRRYLVLQHLESRRN